MAKGYTDEQKLEIIKKVKKHMKDGLFAKDAAKKEGITYQSYIIWLEQVKDEKNKKLIRGLK